MKDVLSRLAYALTTGLALTLIFGGQPTISPTDTITVKLATYLGYYAFPIAIAVVIIECSHLIRTLIRRRTQKSIDN